MAAAADIRDITARDIVLYVYGFSRGDERVARVVLDGILAEGGEGTIRGVAGRHGFSESTVRRWVAEAREGVSVAVGRVGRG